MNLMLRKEVVVEDMGSMLISGGSGVGKTAFLRTALHSSIYYGREPDTGYWVITCGSQNEFSDFEGIPFVTIFNEWNTDVVDTLFQLTLGDKREYKNNVFIFDDFYKPTVVCRNIQKSEELECDSDSSLCIQDEYENYIRAWDAFNLMSDYENACYTFWVNVNRQIHNWSLVDGTLIGKPKSEDIFPLGVEYFDTRVAMFSSWSEMPTALDIYKEGNSVNLSKNPNNPILKSKGIIAVKKGQDRNANAEIWRVPFLPLGKRMVN